MRTLHAALLVGLVVAACSEPAAPQSSPIAPPSATPTTTAPTSAGDDEGGDFAAVAATGAPARTLAIDTSDLPGIQKRKALRVLVFGVERDNLPRGGGAPTDRELATAFAARLDVAPEFILVDRFEDLIPWLVEGKGDVVAAQMTKTAAREQRVDFTRPTAVVSELLVAKKGDAAAPATKEQLAGKPVRVRASSSYAESLQKVGAVVDPADEVLDEWQIAADVADGKAPLTVVDSDIFADIARTDDRLEAKFPVAEGRVIAWAVRKEARELKAAADAFLTEAAMTNHTDKIFTGDLDGIVKRGVLRVLTKNDAAAYFLFRGQQMGFDYELMKLFCDEHKLRIEVVVPPDETQLAAWLLDGQGDVVAAEMATLPGTASSKPYKDDAVLSVRPSSTKLLAALDAFVAKRYRGLEYNVLKKKYFEDLRTQQKGATESYEAKGAVSPYDELFKKYGAMYGLDWRLLAAQAYQESRFDPKARSWVGAQGLFQVMPATGKEMGFTNLEDPEQGVHAGARYMAQLVDSFDPKIPFKHRMRFALASYNAGKGHVLDAMRIAGDRGLQPGKWFKNVEQTMLALEDAKVHRKARFGYCRGSEPVKYVSEIQSRYDNYVRIVEQQGAAK